MKLIAVLILSLLSLACPSADSGDLGRTPRGASVRGAEGVTVTPEHRAALDRGLFATFAKARCRGYSRALAPTGYTVLFRPGTIDSAGNPALKLPCGAYCGTEWDKGGYMLVAGYVENGVIVLPEHTTQTANLERIAAYEAEHIVLKANDDAEYERTKVHRNGAGHPIIPDCN